MVGVLLADDQALLREGFRLLLESDPELEVVGEASDGREAVVVARELRPDVTLMDLRMPVLDGIAATREICADRPESRVLILTTFDDDDLVAAALQAGASGFLLKSAAGRQLIDAVKAVHRGEALLAPELIRRLVEKLLVTSVGAGTSTTPTADDASERIASVSAREAEVLRLIGRGRSNAEIAAELFVSVATVKSHVNSLFSKIHVRDRAQAVIVAYECGLVTPGQP